MKITLWVCMGLVFYAYVGYPMVMWAFAYGARRVSAAARISPSVSMVLAVCNGMAHLPSKIDQLLHLDYANIKDIIVISDGSTDGSAEYLATLADPRLKMVVLDDHQGKAVALNAGMKETTAEVIVFVDVRPDLAPGAVQRLVSHFADPSVGCVAGELVLIQHGQSSVPAAVGGLYWRYEQWIRRCESSYDSPVGVYGGFYAIRRELAIPQPAGLILDDMFEPLSVIRQGYRSVLEPRARVYDQWPKKTRAEFHRKVRTLAGNFQLMQLAPWILTPKNRVLFQLISHKILRLFVPYLLISILVFSLLLAAGSRFYAVLACVQIFCLLLAVLGLQFKMPVLERVTGPVSALLMLNTAAVVALYKFIATRGPLCQIWDSITPSEGGNHWQHDWSEAYSSAIAGHVQPISCSVIEPSREGNIK